MEILQLASADKISPESISCLISKTRFELPQIPHLLQTGSISYKSPGFVVGSCGGSALIIILADLPSILILLMVKQLRFGQSGVRFFFQTAKPCFFRELLRHQHQLISYSLYFNL